MFNELENPIKGWEFDKMERTTNAGGSEEWLVVLSRKTDGKQVMGSAEDSPYFAWARAVSQAEMVNQGLDQKPSEPLSAT